MILEFVICQGEYDFHESGAKLVIIWFLMDLDEGISDKKARAKFRPVDLVHGQWWMVLKQRPFILEFNQKLMTYRM